MSDPRRSTMPLGMHTFMDRFGPLPSNFFHKVPIGAKAVFSTEEGKKPLRSCCMGQRMSPQVVRSDDMKAMMNKVQFLRRTMPETCDQVKAPKCIWDLYNYFDSLDLWTESAGFLGGVLEEIFLQNEKKRVVIDEYINEFVKYPEIRRQCDKIPLGEMHQLLTPETRAELDYDTLTKAEQHMMVESLNRCRQQIEQELAQAFQAQQAELDQVAAQTRVVSHDAVRLGNTRVHVTRRPSGGRALSHQNLPKGQLKIAPESTQIDILPEQGPSHHLIPEVHSTSAPSSTHIGIIHEIPAMPITPVILSQPAFSPAAVKHSGLREVPSNAIRHRNNEQHQMINAPFISTNDVNNENRIAQKLHSTSNDNRNIRKLQSATQQQYKQNIHREQHADPVYIHNPQKQILGYHSATAHKTGPNNHWHQHSLSNGQSLSWVHNDMLPPNQIYPFLREKTTNRGSWKLAGLDKTETYKHQVYIRDLPNDANITDDLMLAVSEFGKVLSINFAMDNLTGDFYGRAWVGFGDEESVSRAIRHLHKKNYRGKAIQVLKHEYHKYNSNSRANSQHITPPRSKNTNRYNSGHKSKSGQITPPHAKNENKYDSYPKSGLQGTAPTEVIDANMYDSSLKSKIRTSPTETKTCGQQHEVCGTQARVRMESQDARNYLPSSDPRLSPNGQENGSWASNTTGSSPTNQVFAASPYNHRTPHITHSHVGNFDIVQHRSSYGSPRAYNSAPLRPQCISPEVQNVPFTKHLQLTVREMAVNTQHDQFTTPGQPQLRTSMEDINSREAPPKYVHNEQVMGKNELVPFKRSKFEASQRIDHTQSATISNVNTMRSSNQDVGSPSQDESTAHVKQKKGARTSSGEPRKSQVKQRDEEFSTILPRAKSSERIRVALPLNRLEQGVSPLANDKEKKEMNEASQNRRLPETAVFDFESRAAKMPSSRSPKAQKANSTTGLSTGSSLMASTSISTNPSGQGTISVSTNRTAITDNDISSRSPQNAGEYFLDVEQVQDRLNLISKQKRIAANTEGSKKRENNAHQRNSARSEENKSSPTKKNTSSNSSSFHKRKTSSISVSKPKDKKTSTSPKIQSKNEQDAAMVSTIPSLNDEMQFPALGSSKISPAINRNRGGSFVAALSGGKQPGELDISLRGSLLRQNSILTSLPISVTNDESKVEILNTEHDEAWPQAHFGR